MNLQLSQDKTIDLKVLIFDQSNIVCDGGSQIEGFGTKRSDYDLYLIFDADQREANGIPDTTFDYHMPVGEIDGRTVDIELMSKQYLSNLADTINQLEGKPNNKIVNVKLERLNTYYRMCIARALYNGDDFAPIQAKFDKERFRGLFALWCELHTARTKREGRAQLDAGEDEAAFETYRDCYQFATDSHLAKHGEAFTSRKYRFSKLARRFGRDSEVFQRCWGLKSLGNRTIADYVREVEKLCDDFGLKADIAAEERVQMARARKAFTPFKVGQQHYLVENRTHMVPVPADAIALWPDLDGKTDMDQLAATLAQREKIGADAAGKRVRDALEALEKVGACARSYAPRHS